MLKCYENMCTLVRIMCVFLLIVHAIHINFNPIVSNTPTKKYFCQICFYNIPSFHVMLLPYNGPHAKESFKE